MEDITASSGPSGRDDSDRNDSERDGGGPDDGEFVRLLTAHQLKLRAYLIAMVRTDSDADDLLQETNVTLWNKREQYDATRPFYSWACGMAFIEVLRLRRRRATDRLWFDEPLLQQLSDRMAGEGDRFDDRREALAGCVGRLRENDRWLVLSRYRDGVATDQLAESLGKPVKTIYSVLARIRETLFRCVEATLAANEHPTPRPNPSG